MEQQNNINNQDEDIKKNDVELHRKRLKRKKLKKILKRRRKKKRIAYINSLPLIKLLSKIDDKLFLKIFKDNRKGYFKSFMKFMSRLGDGYVWAGIYLIFYMFRIDYALVYFSRALTAAIICIFVFYTPRIFSAVFVHIKSMEKYL